MNNERRNYFFQLLVFFFSLLISVFLKRQYTNDTVPLTTLRPIFCNYVIGNVTSFDNRMLKKLKQIKENKNYKERVRQRQRNP